ncbi:hypothetical protein Syun_024457 [Stephania yunnanensis]|uniref:Uncharacterized protein n=1 Tax=Stephania yunnanensis TaxID=152371 RepID=A0AAP0NKS9_9MAGN
MINDNEVAVNVEPADRYIAERIRNRIQSLPPLKSCIYRVPEKFRIGKEEVYMPKIIAIGPYHRNNPKLEAMEEHKQRYLQAFLIRCSKQLEEVVKSIRVLQQDARDCYADPINDMSTDDFIIMMLVDGCFILELLCRYSDDVEETNDQIFMSTWMIPSLRRDLVMLENQIPFIVLEALFKFINNSTAKRVYNINRIIIPFFDAIIPTIQQAQAKEDTKGKHLLDLLRSQLLPSSQLVEFGSYVYWEFTKCATDIHEAGVKFKKRMNGDGLLDIRFENGVLEIPPFYFGESVTVLLPNMIALEQCQGYSDQITSYIFLLNSLINSPNDVKLLRDRDIIDSMFNEDERVAIAIGSMCKGVVVNEFYYDLLCHRVNVYCRKWRATWNRNYLKSLQRDYFNSPWAFVSFIAAVILLALTFTQTLYSILSYYAPSQNHS